MTIKNKRGIFFTTLVIVILSLFAITYTFYSTVKQREPIQKRIETLNNFVFSTEEDIERKLKISGFRIIFVLEKRIVETGGYIQNVQNEFTNIYFNGLPLTDPNYNLIAGTTFNDMLTDLNNKAAKVNAQIQINSPQIIISQNNPWYINVTLKSRIIIEDKADLVKWDKNPIAISAHISIENFEDPVYIISTNGRVTNKIAKTPSPTFIQGNDISRLLAHVQNSSYLNKTDAPSFLSRMQGQITTASPNGIESLVNLEKLAVEGIEIQDKSVVDHIYFSSTSPSACRVQPAGMPPWFKLDNAHLTTYQVTCAP